MEQNAVYRLIPNKTAMATTQGHIAVAGKDLPC
jgi:hypothetical protein